MDKPIAIFGCGYYGMELTKLLNHDILCFIDNHIIDGTIVEGLRVYNLPHFLEEFETRNIIIGSMNFYAEIKAQLNAIGITEIPCLNLSSTKLTQYFDLPQLFHAENEVFIDGGGLDGESSLNFLKWSEGHSKARKILIFEPSVKSAEVCEETLKGVNVDWVVIRKGLFDKAGTQCFQTCPQSPHQATIRSNGETIIEVDALDNICYNDHPTFIKLDIEGAESKAIEGMKHIIRDYKPKLAICVYHKPHDVWSIPLEVKEIRNDYSFYLRHYSMLACETVLYAV
ncbi:MAG: FkbM family methyltransferase [Clostridiales bacterium]|nr:FkbM family methyltransferase [Clostridiales bacterium]